MAFLGNDAVNRVNLHSGIQALAQAGGGIFFFVYMVQAGVPPPVALLAQAAIHAGRLIIRPVILPLAKRFGLRPLVVTGALLQAAQYPVLSQLAGVGPMLAALIAVVALADIFYWPTYNAYFAAVGDDEHRGHQVSAREMLVAAAGVAAPIAATWALVTLGPGPMFAAVGVVQALSILPLLGAPNIAVRAEAPGAYRAASIGVQYNFIDGWFDTWFFYVWQIALFLTLGASMAAYGGAMALAALVGAAFGLLLGRHIDRGGWRRALALSIGALAIVVVARASSGGLPWLAVAANAGGAMAMTLFSPVIGAAFYNVTKASPCPTRFLLAAEAGWDLGAIAGCALAASLLYLHAPPTWVTLLGLPALGAAAWVLSRIYRGREAGLSVAQ